MKKRYDELVKIINQANYDYHTLDNPKISDQEYDKYLRELYLLEENHPELRDPNSPTSRAGGKILDGFEKVVHQIPMLSLANVFNEEEIRAFDNKIKKAGITDPNYVCELKIDGLSFSLHYEKGKLTRAATRGDGEIGEDITANVMTIKTVPLVLKEAVDIEVRGEIYMSKKTFEELNKEREKSGAQLFQNPRNAAAGSVRQLDSKITSKRKLDCWIYHLPNAKEYGITTQDESLDYLRSLGFKVNNKEKLAKTIDEVLDYVEEATAKRHNLEYDIDGVVIKLNSIKDQEKLGFTARTPKWATSYKFPAEDSYTKLIDIIFTVGRTGQITPNAVLEPVLVQGSTIRRATLHNENFILEKGLKIGDIVSVRKAADVIPEVGGVLTQRRDGSEKDFVMIDKCPICSSTLEKKAGQVDHYCLNPYCDGRKIEGLIHFVSRQAMNIDGLGERIVEDFFNMGFIKDFSSIYAIADHREELVELEGFGTKSIDKLIESVESSKENSLEKLIFALGIENVGEKTAKVLAKEYKTLDKLMQATSDDLIKISDIGGIIASSISNYFARNEVKEEIEKLRALGINFNYLGKENTNDLFSGKTFVVTGSLSNYSRDEIHQLIEDLGGKTSSSVSKKTSVLVAGLEAGSKLEKAKELGIEIWSEEEFLNKIK